ncbi:MAG: DUF2442 domain-containing protein [Thermoguttaceae bacterium]
MPSSQLGENTSAIEVTNISAHGLWLLVGGKEYFLPYEKFPWFKDAKVSDILDVTLLHGFHLHWPKLDVDLELAALKNPDQFPLVDVVRR